MYPWFIVLGDFSCRGLAHIGLHDAVLDGNIDVVKATLVRYIDKHPSKINEHDVSGNWIYVYLDRLVCIFIPQRYYTFPSSVVPLWA